MERIPQNLKSSAAYCVADDCVAVITDAMVFLMDAFG